MKTTLYLLILQALIFTACSTENAETEFGVPHYEIYLDIQPEKNYIKVEGTFKLNPSLLSTDSLGFYLDKKLVIHNFSFGRRTKALIDTAKSDNRFIPEARKVYFKLKEGQRNRSKATVFFSYEGELSQLPKFYANVTSASWTEIGLYLPWFPLTYPEPGNFTYCVEVSADKKYTVVGLGKNESKDGKTVLSSLSPTNDIVVCLSPDIQVFNKSMGRNNLKIVHKQFPDSMLHKMSNDIADMMSGFNERFGALDMDLCIIETQRAEGGGYARTGGLVLGDISAENYSRQQVAYHRYFAHELAHLWWKKAPVNSWEDWLNEGFAEYCALISLKHRFGKEVYDDYISSRMEKMKGTQAIWGFDRNRVEYKIATALLYNKAPLLLIELEEKIGEDAFTRICRKLHEQESINTKDFLTILSKESGSENALWFEKLLKER